MDIYHEPQKNITNDRPNPWRNLLKDAWQTVLLSLLIFGAINFVTLRIRVHSISMQPTLFERDFVLVNKLAYKIGDLNRRDVVVFQPPLDSEQEPYIKRVIGLPGDTVRVTSGVVYINDLPLHESYEAAPPNYNGEWKVPQGKVFVLGDNRNNSSDSHIWGMVPVQNIIGKAVMVYWPFTHWKVLDPTTAAAAGL